MGDAYWKQRHKEKKDHEERFSVKGQALQECKLCGTQYFVEPIKEMCYCMSCNDMCDDSPYPEEISDEEQAKWKSVCPTCHPVPLGWLTLPAGECDFRIVMMDPEFKSRLVHTCKADCPKKGPMQTDV